jgi:hypothetical protein
MWTEKAASLADLPVRGRFRPVTTPHLAIINIRLGEFGDAGDPAFLAFHFLSAYYPSSGISQCTYYPISLNVDPSKSRQLKLYQKKIDGIVKEIRAYV